MASIRIHRLDPAEPLPFGRRSPTRSRQPWSVGACATTAGRLDLGSRISLAADVQATAGNAAMAHVAGFARVDHKTPPPKGVTDIGAAAHSPGNRGYTQSRYTANTPLFRIGKTEQVNGTWEVRPADVRLPELDFDVWWPAPGRHLLGAYGKGSHYLDVTEEWSTRLQKGEEEHVHDTEKAYAATWGRVARLINEAAAGAPSTGSTVDAARASAWQRFVGRLPKGFQPAGDAPTTEAQEALWDADNDKTIFRQLMNETKAVRDGKLWHMPDESQKEVVGDDRIDELSVGNSQIEKVTSDKLIGDAWKRLTGSELT